MISFSKETVIVVMTAALGSELLFHLYKKLEKKFLSPIYAKNNQLQVLNEHKKCESVNIRKESDEWNTVLFFPDPLINLELLRNHDYKTWGIEARGTLVQFHEYFSKAEMSIKICYFLSSLHSFSYLIREMRKKGIFITVITDMDSLAQHDNYNAKDFMKYRIPLKVAKEFMHNKFAIIDDEAVLTGSLNLTRQGVIGNMENVVVTMNKKIVKKYVDEFNLIWSRGVEPPRSLLDKR